MNGPETEPSLLSRAAGTPVVYVVDDHAEMCASIEALLSSRGIKVRCFQDSAAFVREAGKLPSGLVLLDLRMPGMSGLEVLAALKAMLRKLPVIMITGHGEIEDAVKAIKAGAKDFLQKPFKGDALISIIDTEWATLNRRAANEVAVPGLENLTPRERDVVLALAKGKPNKVIANELGISARTVEMHRARAMSRLNCRTFADLLRMIFLQPAPQGDQGHISHLGK